MAEKTLTLRVLFYLEGDQWVAQCVDHDITAHGETIPKAQRAFEMAVVSEIIVAVESQREPFADPRTVPPLFAEAFEDALAEKLEQRHIDVPPGVQLPPAFMVGAIAAERRIASAF